MTAPVDGTLAGQVSAARGLSRKRRQDQAGAHRGPAVESREPVLDDHRPDRVADGRTEYRGRSQQRARAAGDIDADEGDDPSEPDEQAEGSPRGGALVGIEAHGEYGDDQRHRGDHDRRERG